MSMEVLLIVLVILMIGVLPAWPHSQGWGYTPPAILMVVIVIIVLLLLR